LNLFVHHSTQKLSVWTKINVTCVGEAGGAEGAEEEEIMKTEVEEMDTEEGEEVEMTIKLPCLGFPG